jgi:hypothetical protein
MGPKPTALSNTGCWNIYTTLLRHSGSKNQNNTTKPKINEKKKNKTKK